MFHYTFIYFSLFVPYICQCLHSWKTHVLARGKRYKKERKSFLMLMANEMDEIHINNENSFYSPASDHQCILLRILVAKGIDLKLSNVAGGSDLLERSGDTKQVVLACINSVFPRLHVNSFSSGLCDEVRWKRVAVSAPVFEACVKYNQSCKNSNCREKNTISIYQYGMSKEKH